jgi:hypothetical protein
MWHGIVASVLDAVSIKLLIRRRRHRRRRRRSVRPAAAACCNDACQNCLLSHLLGRSAHMPCEFAESPFQFVPKLKQVQEGDCNRRAQTTAKTQHGSASYLRRAGAVLPIDHSMKDASLGQPSSCT